jgi:hypothetical protein
VGFSMHTGLGIKTVPYDSRSDVLMYKIIWEGVLKVMIAVSNILPLPNHPLIKGRELDFYCFPPLQGGGVKMWWKLRDTTFKTFSKRWLGNVY